MRRSGLVAGMATAIGSLPHRDAHAAASLVLRCVPELPAAPQLPCLTPREGVVAQWAGGVPGLVVRADGSLDCNAVDRDAPPTPEFTRAAHGSLLTFLEVSAEQPELPQRVKVQITGPLTLGVALVDAGVRAADAFPLASRVAGAWAVAVEHLVAQSLPDTALVLFFDEPSLVCWRDNDGPVEREVAIDLLSSSLAATRAVTGVHLCGSGDLRCALDAGPNIVHFDAGALDVDHALALTRFLEGGGWIAWGAIPTDGPIGEEANSLWRRLLEIWCELTRRGCDPARLCSQALVAPACGLAGHGVSQAERALLLARELGRRMHGHAAACKLAVGA